MNCKQIHNKLIFFIEGDLKQSESDNINLHLKDCKDCENLFYQLKASLEFIEKDKLVEINPFFSTRVMERLAQQPKQNSIFNWFKIRQYSVQVSIYSFLIVLAIFVGYYLGKDNTVVDVNLSSTDRIMTDNQLFVESYQIQIKDEDVYLISNDDNTK